MTGDGDQGVIIIPKHGETGLSTPVLPQAISVSQAPPSLIPNGMSREHVFVCVGGRQMRTDKSAITKLPR